MGLTACRGRVGLGVRLLNVRLRLMRRLSRHCMWFGTVLCYVGVEHICLVIVANFVILRKAMVDLVQSHPIRLVLRNTKIVHEVLKHRRSKPSRE